MADTRNPQSPDSSHDEQLKETKTSQQPKFTTHTTFSDVLMHDITNLERQNITNLKKEVLVDLTMHIMHKYKQSPNANKQVIDNIKTLQDQISQAEINLSQKVSVIEETIKNTRNIVYIVTFVTFVFSRS